MALGQAYSQVGLRHYGEGGDPNVFSSVLRKSREWPWRTVGGGFEPPKLPWPRHCVDIVQTKSLSADLQTADSLLIVYTRKRRNTRR